MPTEPTFADAPLYSGAGPYPGQKAQATSIGLPTAWDATKGDATVYVCVLGSGVELTHPDLQRATNAGVDVATGNAGGLAPGATADDAHGTALAGVAVAAWGNGAGIAGVAGDCSLYSLALPGAFTSADVALGIERVITPPAAAGLVSASRMVLLLPAPGAAAAAECGPKLVAADGANIVVVMPSGDDDSAALPYPAGVGNVIVCGAVDASGARWSPSAGVGSSYGGLGIVAPGKNVPVTDLVGAAGMNPPQAPGFPPAADYALMSGTEPAAAMVAGVVALMLSVNPKLVPADVKRYVEATATKVGAYTYGLADAQHPNGTWTLEVGYGRVDAAAAVALAMEPRVAVVAPGGTGFGAVNVGAAVDIVLTFTYEDVVGRFSAFDPGGSTPVVCTIGALPADVTIASGSASFTLTTASSPQSVTLRYSPAGAAAEWSANLDVTTDDPHAASFSFVLSGSAVAAATMPVRAVLVIDHSGSMSEGTSTAGKTKADAAVAAADLFVTMLHEDDHLGIVRFDHLAADPDDVLLAHRDGGGALDGLVPAGPFGSPRTELRARLTTTPSDLGPRGSTSIGGGIALGSRVLDTHPAGASETRALVVLTDGLQNTPPSIAEGRAVVDSALHGAQRVFAVGLGLNTAAMSQFDEITSVTKGVAYSTGATTADLQAAQALFVKILASTTDADFAVDPVRVANEGESQATDVILGEVDVEADFVVIYDADGWFPKYLRVELETPDGTRLSTQAIAAGAAPELKVVQRPGHVVIRARLPAFPAKPRAANFGRYRLWVTNAAGLDDGQKPGRHSVRYTSMVSVRSALKLRGRITQPSKDPGSAFGIVLEPTLRGLPVRIDGAPDVRVRRPDGVVRAATFARDAHGAYRASFDDTSVVGTYDVDATVRVTTPSGSHLTRVVFLQASVLPPGTVPVDPSGGREQPPPGGTTRPPADDHSRCGGASRVLRAIADAVEHRCGHHPHRCRCRC